MAKLFFYDLETTGLNFKTNAIHQISGMIVVDGEVRERFEFKVQPHFGAVIDDAALVVSNRTKEEILAYPPIKQVYAKLFALFTKYVDRFDRFDKYVLAGYNNLSFDNHFFREFVTKHCDDKYYGSYFWSNSIDVFALASDHLKDERHKMSDFKLRSVAKQLGIEVDESKLHDAQYDIELTYQIYLKVTK